MNTDPLAAAARCGPYFTVATGPGDGPRLAELYADPELVAAQVDRTRAALGDVEARVAAATWHLAFCAYLWSPLLGAYASGAVPMFDPEHTWWNPDGPTRLSTTAVTWSPPRADTLRHAALETHLVPMLHAVRAAVRIAEPLLWGNIASAAMGALRVLGPAAPEASTRAVVEPLEAGRFTEDGFVRRSCCLFYRVPGGGYCGDCPLVRR